MKTGVRLVIAAALLINGALSHSWIACTDYLQENGDYWSEANCRAYARHGHNFTPKTQFGLDKGYDFNGASEDKACKTPRDDNASYNSDYPMAVYYAGQKVVIAHPTKNHVAETCTNKYIPDNGNYVYVSSTNPSADPKLSEFRANKVADLGVSPFGHSRTTAEITTYPKPGYQNAPKFCENMDKALATAAFYIPDLAEGRYTFMWEWSFNHNNDVYTSCWEADVVRSKSDRDNKLAGRGLPVREPEVLHGRSLAGPAPSIGGGQVTPAPTVPVTSRPQATQPPPTARGSTSSPIPVPSTMQCLDTCFKQCYSCN